jgi:hypothetical protein
MKANDVLFRVKEVLSELNAKFPQLSDSIAIENVQRIAEMTRLSSELQQRLIMLETLIHKESGLQADQNAAMRHFLRDLKQVVATKNNAETKASDFIQFAAPTKEEVKVSAAEAPKTPEIKVNIEPPIEVKVPVAKEGAVSSSEEIPKTSDIKSSMVSKPVSLAINDRFRIMNELFSKQAHKLDEHIKIFNESDKSTAISHWRGLVSQFNWDEDLEIVKTFKSIIFNRYA